MVTICLIDDQIEYLDSVEQILNNNLNECKIIKMTEFNSHYIEDEIIDLFILDIDMKGINGIDLAILLKNSYPFVDIAFISAHNNLVHNSLKVRPIYFIRKDHLIEDFKVLFKLIDFDLYKQQLSLNDIDGNPRCFQINSISYVEVMIHKVTVHFEHHNYIFSLTLKEFLHSINSEYIIQIHKSYLVNINKINYVNGDLCYISDNLSLPIGRKYKKKFIETYRRLL